MLAIEAKGLTKIFQKRRPLSTVLLRPWVRAIRVRALKGVDLAVPAGRVLGVLGVNGAGKSTLIKILASLIRQTGGEARVNGFDVGSEAARVRASVGIVTSDERSLYWRLTGRENLRFFSRLYDLPPRRVRFRVQEVLELMDLKEKADDPVLSYSTGMRQRLAIARALLHDPPVIFLDEPTRSLDPTAAKRLRAFIAERLNRERGKTVLLATHNLLEAEELCHRVAILQGGEVIAEGTVEEITGSCLGAETYVLIVRTPEGGQELGPDAERLEPGLYRLSVHLPREEGALGRRIRSLLEEGVQIVSCTRRDPVLQVLFDRPKPPGGP